MYEAIHHGRVCSSSFNCRVCVFARPGAPAYAQTINQSRHRGMLVPRLCTALFVEMLRQPGQRRLLFVEVFHKLGILSKIQQFTLCL